MDSLLFTATSGASRVL
ncbi:flagellar hook-basal body family protein, partial [Vibrio parahaemolyticus AQ3810]